MNGPQIVHLIRHELQDAVGVARYASRGDWSTEKTGRELIFPPRRRCILRA